MRPRPASWLILSLVLALALLLRTDSPALAAPASVTVAGGPIAYQGLRSSGVTITGAVNNVQTSIPISDSSRLKVGQIVETQDAAKEIMLINSLGAGTMGVTRGVLTTAAATHNNGTALYADFTQFKVRATGVGYRDTGVTLNSALDTVNLENSGAFLTQAISTGDTTLYVSNSSLLTNVSTLRFDGAAYVSVTNKTYLGSTGRSVSCPLSLLAGNNILYGCVTLGATPVGPTGSGILAEVRLRADRVGTISLGLSHVILTQIDGTTQLTLSEVLGGTVTVVSGSPPPPPAPSSNCGGGGTKVCVQPSSITVGVGTEFTVSVVAQSVTNLGSYQFRMTWTPATEDMALTSVVRGTTDGYKNANLSADVDAAVTTIPLNQVGLLQAGMTVKLADASTEEMLVLAVNAGPPASMSVLRGYNSTTAAAHAVNAPVWGGFDRVTVTRAAKATPQSAGTDFRAGLRVLRVNNHTPLTAGALQIDSEWFRVLEVPARTLRSTGHTLANAVGAGDTTLTLSGVANLQAGRIIQVDSELMGVLSLSGATAQVWRGIYGSTAASHNLGASVASLWPEDNTAKVTRGFQSTTIQSHAVGAPIIDVDGLGDYAFTLGSPGAPATLGFTFAANSTFLGQSGRTPSCGAPGFPGNDVSLTCNTGASALPLGPTGTGTLATVNVTGRQFLAGAPAQALNLSGVTLRDVSGDTLESVTVAGSARVVKCPDFDGNRNVDFVGDIIDVAKAALVPGWPKKPAHDIDGNGIVDFVGDVIMSAQLALDSQPQPLRCPPPQP